MGFEELKQRQSLMWGSGPYERITATIADMHELVVRRLGPRSEQRWLDVATGTGALARLAARAGADVTGLDLSPALIETARELATGQGLSISFDVGDAEALPYEDASFDAVTSTCGVMFAPDHSSVARELARATRAGGRLALTAWRSDGGVGDLFRLMAPFQAPPPPGAGSPFDWGREDHVSELLGGAFELEYEEADSPYEPETGEEVWELFSTAYGPTRTLADSLEPERRAEFHRAWVDYFEGLRKDGRIRQSRPYLITLGRRR